MAGRGGFEPPEVLPSPVFKTGTFDHSDISRHFIRVEFYLNKIKTYLKSDGTSNIFWYLMFHLMVPGAGLEPARSQ